MDTRFLTTNVFLATFLSVAAPLLRAQDGVQGALREFNRTTSSRQILGLSGPTLAIADFDGDNKPDGAILLNSSPLGQGNFEIELHLTGYSDNEIKFHSLESTLTVEALDIDHDGDIDLVIEQSISHKRLQIWVNDGHGKFEKGRLEDFPSAAAPTHEQVRSPERLDAPAFSLPTQRGFETMLLACHIVGRPPSENQFAALSKKHPPKDQAFSLTPSRAPPLS
ncbi:MAG TPA: VCBS repeat-containing protein [Terriglobales bacterium]|nr:VCBS repeat-containing protein [Terriglobales bacterium]